MALSNSANDMMHLKLLSTTSSFEEVVLLPHHIEAFNDRQINIDNIGKFEMPVTMIDNTALTVLLKEDRMDDITPINTTGDGNCLFNAASITICKSETLGIELRLRTALELLTIADFYGSHPIVSSMDLTTLYGNRWPKEGIYDAIICSNTAVRVHAREGFQRALQHEIYNTLYNLRYSGILLQIMGLSSAIGCEIKVVYPDKRHSLLPLLTTTYRPRVRNSQQLPRITIMMTDTSGWTDRSKEFTVNHFVPMMKIDPTSTANKWTEVKRKRYSATRKTQNKPDMKKPRLFSRKSKVTLQDFFTSKNSSPREPNSPMNSPSSKPNTPMNSPPNTPYTPMDSPPSKPNHPINNPSSKPITLMDSPPNTLYTPMDSPPSKPSSLMNSTSSKPIMPMDSPPNTPYMPMDSPPSKPNSPMNGPSSKPITPMESPPNTSYTPMDRPPSKPNHPMSIPSSKPKTPMDSTPNTPYTPMDSPLSKPISLMNSPPSKPNTSMDNPPSTRNTPMDSPPPNTHKINANLDLPADFKPTEDHSSSLPLSVGRSFYKKCGELYQKNSATRRKSHGQAKVNQLLECRRSNVTGTLQENISSLKQKLPFSNLQIFPSELGSIAVAKHILQHCTRMPRKLQVNIG